MDILTNAKKHFDEISGVLSKIEVPEWGDDSGPAVIYSKPINMTQKSEMYGLQEQNKFDEYMFLQLFHMARNKDGIRLFRREDRDDFMKRVDPDVMSSVVNKLKNELTAEEIEKN